MTAGEAIAHEMRLFDDEGKRLYLTADERARFLKASTDEDREDRLFCRLLHFSGCRPSEALELTPGRISLDFGLIQNPGLRISEALAVKVRDIRLDNDLARSVRVVGKGDKELLLPLPEAFGQVFGAWLQRLNAAIMDTQLCIQ